MKVIILKTEQEFESLQNRIHLALQENIQGYNATRWANANLKNIITNEIACPIEDSGVRGAITLGFVLTDEEKQLIVELDDGDENWFPRILIGPPMEGI